MAAKIQNGHQNTINCYFLASNWDRNTNLCSISGFIIQINQIWML